MIFESVIHMDKIKEGDKLQIHCYKHNGRLERVSDEAIVLEINEDWIVCGNYKTKITEDDGRSYKTKEPAILFFYKKRWFNVIGQLKKYGLFYYCNIATPYLIENGIIKYIDYDLDLRVFPDGGFKVLDRNEYNYHRKVMHYPEELNIILKNELTSLIEMKRNNEGPFAQELVEKYYKKYQELTEN